MELCLGSYEPTNVYQYSLGTTRMWRPPYDEPLCCCDCISSRRMTVINKASVALKDGGKGLSSFEMQSLGFCRSWRVTDINFGNFTELCIILNNSLVGSLAIDFKGT
jgi:hypothetical protein